MKRNLN